MKRVKRAVQSWLWEAKYLKDQLAGQLGRGGGSTVMAPPAEVSMGEMDIPEGDESTGLRSILSALASGGGERQADATTSEELGEPLRLNVGGSTTPIYGGSTGNPNPSFFDRLITGLTPSNFGCIKFLISSLLCIGSNSLANITLKFVIFFFNSFIYFI